MSHQQPASNGRQETAPRTAPPNSPYDLNDQQDQSARRNDQIRHPSHNSAMAQENDLRNVKDSRQIMPSRNKDQTIRLQEYRNEHRNNHHDEHQNKHWNEHLNKYAEANANDIINRSIQQRNPDSLQSPRPAETFRAPPVNSSQAKHHRHQEHCPQYQRPIEFESENFPVPTNQQDNATASIPPHSSHPSADQTESPSRSSDEELKQIFRKLFEEDFITFKGRAVDRLKLHVTERNEFRQRFRKLKSDIRQALESYMNHGSEMPIRTNKSPVQTDSPSSARPSLRTSSYNADQSAYFNAREQDQKQARGDYSPKRYSDHPEHGRLNKNMSHTNHEQWKDDAMQGYTVQDHSAERNSDHPDTRSLTASASTSNQNNNYTNPNRPNAETTTGKRKRSDTDLPQRQSHTDNEKRLHMDPAIKIKKEVDTDTYTGSNTIIYDQKNNRMPRDARPPWDVLPVPRVYPTSSLLDNSISNFGGRLRIGKMGLYLDEDQSACYDVYVGRGCPYDKVGKKCPNNHNVAQEVFNWLVLNLRLSWTGAKALIDRYNANKPSDGHVQLVYPPNPNLGHRA